MGTNYYWIYILHCDNGSYYTGYTSDLKRRYQEHIMGTDKCKYTRSFKPLCIAQSWKITGNKSLAMRIERHIKKMSKKNKEQLVLYPALLTHLFRRKICSQNTKNTSRDHYVFNSAKVQKTIKNRR
jgi:putative endonuclease